MNRFYETQTLLFLLLLTNCLPYIAKRERIKQIRIAILSGIDSVVVTGINQKEFLQDYKISVSDSLPLFLKTKEGRVMVNGKPYRGNLEIKNINNKIWVINVVDIEDYLKGVVPCEIGRITKDLMEAAKAQAIAARTYAYSHINQYAQLGFDLYATTRDQLYGGINAEDELISTAIKKTSGFILTYHGQPIQAKYHSTCGGRTADFNDAWRGIGPPYLKSVVCEFCQISPHYYWEKRMHKDDFLKNLKINLQKIGIKISEKEIIRGFRFKRNPKSGRVISTIVLTDSGEYKVDLYNIRTLFGTPDDPNGLLKSNYFSLEVQNDSIIIKGRGYGHGVGMCQFGAIGMAKRGKNYKEILMHYYPNTKLERH
ncbi:MAG: SpoIID/LytB domain-containing protein [candidate division WOR-3 bacterium]